MALLQGSFLGGYHNRSHLRQTTNDINIEMLAIIILNNEAISANTVTDNDLIV